MRRPHSELVPDPDKMPTEQMAAQLRTLADLDTDPVTANFLDAAARRLEILAPPSAT